jgi:hypothetical protein
MVIDVQSKNVKLYKLFFMGVTFISLMELIIILLNLYLSLTEQDFKI